VIIALALYGWFIRPNLFLETPRFSIEQENLVRLGWYPEFGWWFVRRGDA